MSSEHLIEANASTPAGLVMRGQLWGEATSIPPHVDARVCLIPLQDGLVLWNVTELDFAGVAPLNSTALNRHQAV